MLACVGVYFYIMMAVFQTMNNTFVVEELEDFQDPGTAEVLEGKKNFTIAYLATAGLNVLCMVGCAFCGIKVGSGEPEEAYFVNGEGNVRASSNAAGTQL